MNHRFQSPDAEHVIIHFDSKLKIFKPFDREQAKKYRKRLALKIKDALKESETLN